MDTAQKAIKKELACLEKQIALLKEILGMLDQDILIRRAYRPS